MAAEALPVRPCTNPALPHVVSPRLQVGSSTHHDGLRLCSAKGLRLPSLRGGCLVASSQSADCNSQGGLTGYGECRMTSCATSRATLHLFTQDFSRQGRGRGVSKLAARCCRLKCSFQVLAARLRKSYLSCPHLQATIFSRETLHIPSHLEPGSSTRLAVRLSQLGG